VINIFVKESRLIIIFFLTVIILGSLLAYLSINNISNYKELTEKKISEQQRDLVKQFSADFQIELEGLVANFEAHIQKDSLVNRQWFKNIDTIPEIKQTILMSKNGVFLWPHFTFTNSSAKKENSSLIYLDKIKIAQQNEFVVKDYRTAEANYLSALKVSKSELDSVYALNAISRLYMKMNKYESAFKNYALILTEFSDVTNTSGFPYAYFSVNQLLKMSDPTKTTEVQKLLAVFLTELSEGEIPLNYNTSEELALISEWISQFDENEGVFKLEERIEYISNYLAFVNNYREPIAKIINEETLKITEANIGDFSILKPISGVVDEVLLFNKKNLNPVGFTVSLEKLFAKVRQKHQAAQLNFDYQIELVSTNEQPYVSNNNLVHFSVFSPYFNQHRIKISLKDEYVVEEYVFKRKLIYGMGFILLLGVMVFGLIILVQDIKRKKQMEYLRADFVSNVTHELKTPLTSIYMFAESIFLGRTPSDHYIKKYANIIVKESENLQRMINNILEFSRKENNKLTYEIQDNDLSEIVNSTVKEMNYWLEINKFNVQLEIQQHINAKVNPEGIKQALSNLISNAIKYSGEKKKLIIRLIKKETTASIEVEDFGIGIPEDKLDRIFEKFYRVNSNENETTSGTGLGLTVTKDIIEAQNGKLLVQSTLGKGSKFTIVLNIE